jgi:uncharacterized membrane protein
MKDLSPSQFLARLFSAAALSACIGMLLVHFGACQHFEFTQIDPGEQIAFDKVKPILQDRCLPCHQGDYMGSPVPDFRTADSMFNSGRQPPLVSPGEPDNSRILQVVYLRKDGAEAEMPPVGHGLSATEKNLLGEWIRQGAPWPKGEKLESAAVAASGG